MSLISRLTTWATNQLLTSSALNSEFTNITNLVNNLDAGTTTWTNVKVTTLTPTTVAGTITFDNASTHGIAGTTTNNNATAGNVGEYTQALVAVGSPVSASGSGQYFDVTSLSLTAGDWDVTGMIALIANGATVTYYTAGIGTATGNAATGLLLGTNQLDSYLPTSAFNASVSIPSYRVSLGSTTIYYLKAFSTYSVATPQAYGRLSARRVR